MLDLGLRGVRKTLGDAPNHKLPMSSELLTKIFHCLDFNRQRDIVVWAAAIVMFSCMFRVSNVLATPSTFDPSKHLRRSDITLSSTGAFIKIRWSKTIQFHERQLLFPLPRIPGSILCPTQAIALAFAKSTTAPMDGPAFVYPSHQSFIPLMPKLFTTVIKQCLVSLKAPAHLYASHSFRRGGVSAAFKAGVPIDLIRVIGDWQYDAYMAYITLSQQAIKQAIFNTISS